MVHSIELLLDEQTEQLVQDQWRRLAEAGLPSEHREGESATPRRPHVTLIACRQIADHQASAAAAVVQGRLPMPVVLGAPMIFGSARSRRPDLILVRQVLARVELLELQQQVVAISPPAVDRHFAAGAWAPHVTLARRLAPEQLGAASVALSVSGSRPESEARLTGCRFWQGDLLLARRLI
jgi:2'-5' RNA ligase